MVKVNFIGRLGNNMFQYAIGRIIAEQKGYKLDCPQLPYFKNCVNVDGLILNDNIYHVNTPQHFNIEEVLKHNGGILLDTFAQRMSYYNNYYNQIKHWFNISATGMDTPQPTDLVVHLRLEDYQFHNIVLPAEYLCNQAAAIIRERGCKRGWIVTNDRNHSQVKYFTDRGFMLYNKSELYDYIFMREAQNLIISQSTFSWWAGYLGSGNVYVPRLEVSKTHWKMQPSQDDVDLFPTNLRYQYF